MDNSVWSSVAGGTGTSVMGPSYSYVDNIQSPSALGVGSDGSMSQIARNIDGIVTYVQYLISGPAMGNRFFVKTGGTCTAPDGSSQSRSNYVNNVTDAAEALPESMRRDLGGLASDFNGLIPGMIQDVEGLNPVSLFNSLSADSVPTCECYSCPVSSGLSNGFLNTTLSPDYDPDLCQKVDPSVCKNVESFEDDSATPIIVAVGILFLLQAI
uniref:Uncharacterized protein n=1 Tax=viral metagenome TaxID=1070528 RepID=A0A6C0HFF7_9ZZZZ